MPSRDGLVGNPLVANGVVYQSGPLGRVYANDVRTGKPLWTFSPVMRFDAKLSVVAFWASHHNRGLALAGDKVFVASGDCRLFAIYRKTGQQAWVAESCDPTKNYGITGAPRVGGGLVFIGNATGDYGMARGFVDAFDAESGKRVWRFYTVPGDPSLPFENSAMEMASHTWGDDYWHRTGGGGSGAPWDGLTYDARLGLLYIGTNGPNPYSPIERGFSGGDELFATCIIAVDAKTGRYVWHFKEVPEDAWDLSATAPMQLADLKIHGVTRRVLMQAPKNGFFYVLDAQTGKFISAGQIAAQNWALRIDQSTGRPVMNPDAKYWERPNVPTLFVPGNIGAHVWEAMAYNPELQLVYVPVKTMASMYSPGRTAGVGGHSGTNIDWYYGLRPDASIRAAGQLVAWDPVSQTERWRVTREVPFNGGVLATAGGLIFQGTAEGRFEAFAAATGHKLWSFQVDGEIMAAPTTVNVDGHQMILVASGDGGSAAITHTAGLYSSTPQSDGPARLLAFKLGGTASFKPEPAYAERKLPQPFRPRQAPELAEKGKALYTENCSICHGVDAINAGHGIPDLRAASKETFAQMRTILDGAYLPAGMPSFKHIDDPQIIEIQAFITNQAWTGYEAQESESTTHRTSPRTPKANHD